LAKELAQLYNERQHYEQFKDSLDVADVLVELELEIIDLEQELNAC
jgi:hypothetical protein